METAVFLLIKTLAYSSCFRFALTEAEILQRLPYDADFVFNQDLLKKALKKLVKQGKIKLKNNFYFLDEQDLSSRLQRQKYLEKKQIELAQLLPLLAKIPTIKAVILTGSTAVDNAKREDDLDFMIVCQVGTLWLTRVLVTLLAKVKHKRPLREDNNAWCFNIYLDESEMAMPFERRSLYEAYEILQMKYLLDRDRIQGRFLAANPWLKKHLFYFKQLRFRKFTLRPQAFVLMRFVNYLLFLSQICYRRLKFGEELFTLTPTQAFFNETRYRERIFERMKVKLKQIT